MSTENQAQQSQHSQQQILNLRFFSDPGHGWLEMDMVHIIGLGLAEKISDYSYIQGDYVYLEEDCDATLFLNAAKAAGIEVNYIDLHSNTDSEIRNYARYSSPFSTGRTKC